MTIPFHLPNLPKPQKEHNFEIDNFKPFSHKYLPISCDGSRPVHPAEPFDPLDFASCSDPDPIISPPLPMDSTPFKFIETVKDLGYLASKLSEVDEFAIDLEHNSYRSFQGITCLMQISTRFEDFIVDTLKLWEHIREYLGDPFMDPTKKKIIHGADNDVMWLQRDFGIYVVNLFDTMRASQVLKLERNSLEFLLKYYCNVVSNKEYQCSDWRIRPIPVNMIKYAREDTHYLMFIYDVMRKQLGSKGSELEFGFEYPLLEAYKRSYDVCKRLYSMEKFDKDTSYLFMYGLSDTCLDGEQLGLVAALYGWRDKVSRQEDESCGYVLPNKLILEIAKKKPFNKQELLQLVGYNKEYVLRDVDVILEFMWKSTRVDAYKFKEVACLFKEKMSPTEIVARIEQSRMSATQLPTRMPVVMTRMYPGLMSHAGYVYGPTYVARAPAIYHAQQPRVYSSGFPYSYVNGPFVIHCL